MTPVRFSLASWLSLRPYAALVQRCSSRRGHLGAGSFGRARERQRGVAHHGLGSQRFCGADWSRSAGF